MEIKIKIPTFFAKYRVVLVGGTYYAQKKDHGWRWLGDDGFTWSNCNRCYAKKFKTLEEAISFIDSIKQKVVWVGR